MAAPYRGAFRTWWNIDNGAFSAKIPNCVELLTFSQENLYLRCFTRLKIGFWVRVLHMSSLLFLLNLQIKPKKYSVRKYVWHCYGRKIKHSQCLCRSCRPKSSLKKVLWEFSQNSQENICSGIPFWCFLVNFAKFARASFLQNISRRLLLIIAVSIVGKGVLANQTANYETRTKAYVLIWARSL